MAFPHFYSVRAEADMTNGVNVTSGGVPTLRTAPPPEFGGPGDRWSPETLAVAAVADCLVLTFKAIARTRAFPYRQITCDVQGCLDRKEKVTAFTDFFVKVRLYLPEGASVEEARRLVDMAKNHCLITNSFKATVHFDTAFVVDAAKVATEALAQAG
jgi:organic hydroperoxide reductase OsmC/OhrA